MTTDIGTASLKVLVDPALIAAGVGSAVTSAGPAVSKQASSMGKVVGGSLALGVAAGFGLFKLGDDFKQELNTIRADTGQTGLSLLGLQSDFQKIYTTVPQGMQDVAGAMSTVYQRLGLSGPVLDSVTTSILNLSRITKGDLTTDVTNITGLFNQWNVPASQMVGTLDELYRAYQATGVPVATLSEQVTTQAPYFQSLGLSLQSSIGLVGLLGKVGLSTSNITAGFRKEIVTATQAGKPAATAFREVFDQIKHAPNQLAAAQIGLANFGSRGIQVVDLIRSGKLDYGSLVQQITSTSGDTVAKGASDVQTFSTGLDVLKHKLAVDLKPAADTVFSGMTSALDDVGKWFDKNGPKINQFLVGKDGKSGAVAKAQGIPGDIKNWVTSGEDVITGNTGTGQRGQGIQDFQRGLQQLQTNWPNFVARFHSGATRIATDWDQATADFKRGAGIIGQDASKAGGQINTWIIQPISTFDQTAGNALGKVDTGLVNIGKGIASVMTGFAEMDPKKVFQGLVDAWQGAVRDLNLGNLGSMWDGLGAGFTAAINLVISGWDDLVDHLGIHISIPSWIPGIGGKSWDWDAKSMHITPIGASSGSAPSLASSAGGVRRFHDGGWVPGSNGQEIPAILQAGEYVMPADAAASWRGGSSGDVNHFHIHQPSDRATAKEVIRQRRNAAFLAGGR